MLPMIYRPAAELELQDTYRWYEGCRPGLGRDFMMCVEERVQIMRQFPQAFPEVHREIRQAVIRRFPLLHLLSSNPAFHYSALRFSLFTETDRLEKGKIIPCKPRCPTQQKNVVAQF